jgi:glutaredoxin-like protein NrdH
MMTKREFDRRGIRYDEMALEQHPEKLDEFKAKGLLQAPIVETDTKVWTGFRLDKIKSLENHLKANR